MEDDDYDSFASLSNSDSVPAELLIQFEIQDAMEKADRDFALILSSKKDRETASAMDQKLLQSFKDHSIAKGQASLVASCSKHIPFSVKPSISKSYDQLFTLQDKNTEPEKLVEITNKSKITKNDQDLDEIPKVCISCFVPCETQVKVACGHFYCQDCLRQLCLGAINDIRAPF